MANLNRVTLIGRLTRDVEVRPAGSSTVAEFSLAVNRTWKGSDGQPQEETTFVDVTAWGKTAELAGQYLAKGKQVFVEGRLKLDSWQDKQSGQQRTKLGVVAENLQFLDGGQQSGSGGQSNGRQQTGQQRQQFNGANEYAGSAAAHGGDIPF